jgi:hypothetical protein
MAVIACRPPPLFGRDLKALNFRSSARFALEPISDLFRPVRSKPVYLRL